MPAAETFWAFYVILGGSIAILAAGLSLRLFRKMQGQRLGFQVGALLLLNGGLFGLPLTAVLLPVLNCRDLIGKYGAPTFVCNFGLLQRAMALNLWMAVAVPLLVAGTMILIFAVAGRSLCGWACPVGLISDMLSHIRSFVKGKAREPRARTHKLLQSVKYAGLVLILLMVAALGVSSYSDPDVAAAFKSGLPGEAHKEPACLVCPAPITTCFIPDSVKDVQAGTLSLPPLAMVSLLIFVAFIAGSLYIPRFFCRYFCYLGALGSVFGRRSLMTLNKNLAKCSHCGTCARGCPMRVEGMDKERRDPNVSSAECVLCLNCVSNCPEKALSFRFAGKHVYGGGKAWWKRGMNRGPRSRMP